MEETKFWARLMKALPIVGGFAAIVAPTTVSIAIFFSVLSLNNSVRAELAAHGAILAAHGAMLAAQNEAIATIRSDLRKIDDKVDALSADVVELKISYAESNARLDSIEGRLDSVEVRLTAVERRLPDVEYVDGRFDDLEREVAVLKERVAALARAGGE